MVTSLSDRGLRKIYDTAFGHQANDEHSWPGRAHDAGLRAVYDRGKQDGAKDERKAQHGRPQS